jgi:uncharacterized protein YjbJ (UPF0337 family)
VLECLRVFGHVGFFSLGFLNNLQQQESPSISGKTDVVKGRLKEAASALTGNDRHRAEGKTDQAIGKVKPIAEKAVDKVEQAVTNVRV